MITTDIEGLLPYELDNENPIITAIKDCNYPAVQSLLNRGYDPNVKDDFGTPALIIAVDHYESMVNLLLQANNINVDNTDSLGRTAIMHAVDNKNIPIINIIIEKHPDLNILDNNNQSVLFNIKFDGDLQEKKENLEILKTLLNNGITNIDNNNLLADIIYNYPNFLNFSSYLLNSNTLPDIEVDNIIETLLNKGANVSDDTLRTYYSTLGNPTTSNTFGILLSQAIGYPTLSKFINKFLEKGANPNFS